MATFNNPRKTAATVTASATLARGFHTPVDATAGPLTMTLPNAAPAGVEISVEKVDASTNAVTVSGTIRGASSSIPLTSQYEARTFLSEGSGSWRPVSDHRTATSLAGKRSRNPLRSPPVPPAKVTVTTFQAGHGWTTTGSAAGTDLNDTTDVGLGAQSAKFVTDTAGTSGTLKSTALSTPLDMTGRDWSLLVKVEGLTNLTDLRFYAGDSTLANARNTAMTPIETGGSDFDYLKEGEWAWVTIPWANGSAIGTPDRTNLRTFQFRIQASAGKTATLHVGAVASVPTSPLFPNGVVSFTYDDGRLTGLTRGRTKLDQYGWAGTAYPIRDKITDSAVSNSYATLSALQAARNLSGWEIGAHADLAADHDAGFTTLTAAQVESDLIAELQWYYDNGLGAVDGFAWPRGMSNPVVEAAAARVVSYGRGTYTTAFHQRETFPPANPMRIRAFNVGSTTTLANVTSAVDFAVSSGSWLVFVFHEVVTSPASSLESAISVHDGVIDYIAGLANRPTVLPMADVLRKGAGAGLTDAAVGGDLSGTLNAPKVIKINGVTASNTPTSAGQVPVATGPTAFSWSAPGASDAGYNVNNRITAGEGTIPRQISTGSASLGSSGQMLLTYFTAEVSETITQILLCSGTTAAGATPTLVRAGVYTIDASSNGTLIASIANDTTLLSAASSFYARAFTSSWSKVQGQRYALGVLVVSGATVPSLAGAFASGPAALWNNPPRMTGILAGQTDLPASYAETALTTTSKSLAYAELRR